MVYANNERGPGFNEILFIDRASGEILEDYYNSQLKTMWWLGTWNYPLHVGTIWGLPTKIIWLVTCIILMTSPVTGVWMWWERRPTGRLGLPRRVDARRPRWLVATVTATSIFLPALGLSVVVVLVVEFLMSRLRRMGLTANGISQVVGVCRAPARASAGRRVPIARSTSRRERPRMSTSYSVRFCRSGTNSGASGRGRKLRTWYVSAVG